MSRSIEQLPPVERFEGLSFDPQSMTLTLGYIPAHRPGVTCQLRFPLQTSDVLVGWLVDVLEKLTGNTEFGERLKAIKLLGDKPQGSA